MPGIIGPGGGAGTSSPAVNPQVYFVNAVAKATGLDPRAVYAWTQAEGAYAPGGTGGFNFLNLRPAAGDTGVAGVSSGGFDQFATLNDAIASTVTRIKEPFLQKWLGPVLARGGTPVDQLQAIAVSGWDAGHYTGSYNGKSTIGGKLYGLFASLYGASALGGKPETQPLPEAGGGKSGDQTSLGGQFGGLWGGLTSWIGDKAAYASLYAGLVMFAIVLAIIGLLSMLGVHPRTLAARGVEAAAA